MIPVVFIVIIINNNNNNNNNNNITFLANEGKKYLQNENSPGHNCFEINNNNKAE